MYIRLANAQSPEGFMSLPALLPVNVVLTVVEIFDPRGRFAAFPKGVQTVAPSRLCWKLVVQLDPLSSEYFISSSHTTSMLFLFLLTSFSLPPPGAHCRCCQAKLTATRK